MVDLSSIFAKDSTLEAADRALEAEAMLEPQRPYLGMSSIGESCSRKIWFRFRHVRKEKFDAETIKRFQDGHAGERVIIERLSKVVSITGCQKTYTDIDGHFVGHPDGIVTGILEAPKTKHIFEAKVCSEKKITELKKAKLEVGPKQALRKWNFTYYCQGVLYMFYEGLMRHYLAAATPGVRNWISVRTDADTRGAEILRDKAKRIIYAQEPPERVSNDPSWFECRYCSFSDICHQKVLPDRVCRTCCHSTPSTGGTWTCALGRTGPCEMHVYLPSFVDGEITETTATSVTYKMKSGALWRDGK